MKRRIKSIFIVLAVVLLGLNLMAGRSVTFLHDGNKVTDTIIDMSSRTGHLEYRGNLKVHKSRVWMINFVDGKWNFPAERRQLSGNTDTIFLRNGQVMNVKIIDFSSRRRMFEFLGGGAVPEGQIKRIYFCCTKLPAAYGSKKATSAAASGSAGSRYSAAFWLNGRMTEKPLAYLNNSKTGFTDGFQMNTKDIWMINFENNQWNFAAERVRLNRSVDTIFLKNGRVLYNKVVDFNESSLSFSFRSGSPIHESQVKRIYFCCTPLPPAYGSKVGTGIKRRLKRR